MEEVGPNRVIPQLLGVFREAFEGPRQRWSYFTDQGKDAGILGALATIGAPDASQVFGKSGSSIAAQAYHVTFGLNTSAAWIRGERIPHNWRESWCVTTVDEAAWVDCARTCNHGYEELSQTIESHGASNEEALGGAIGAIAHVAYHLGAVRQKLALVHSR